MSRVVRTEKAIKRFWISFISYMYESKHILSININDNNAVQLLGELVILVVNTVLKTRFHTLFASCLYCYLLYISCSLLKPKSGSPHK